jgi:Sec-independent protein translocase protein TatA
MKNTILYIKIKPSIVMNNAGDKAGSALGELKQNMSTVGSELEQNMSTVGMEILNNTEEAAKKVGTELQMYLVT